MLPIDECRKLLSEDYKNISDDEIMELCKMLDSLAEISIKTYYYDSDKIKTGSPYVSGEQR